MVSSLEMTYPNTQSDMPLSEAVEEILHLAKKAAKKQKAPCLQDRHILLGLIQSSRLFTRLDALLKHTGSSTKRLSRLYQAHKSGFTDASPESTALQQAAQLAMAGAEEKKIQVEHLLLALLDSTDPLVQTILSQSRLTPEKIEAALTTTEKESPLRMVLYCIRETVEVVVVVLFLVIMIKQGLGEFRLIPSESMLPTLQVGDRIVVEKVSHWYRDVQRGDILVFYPPEPEAILKQDPWSVFLRLTGFSGILYDKESKIDTAFIKRVVGLPGDTIEVRPGMGVFVNGKLLPESYTYDIANSCTFIGYCGPIQVPQGMYYMMGDNRNKSADSRYWQFLPQERIIGRAVFRFFPLDKRTGLINPQPVYPKNPS